MPADDLNLPASHGVHNPLMARCWPAGQSNHVSPLSPAALPLCPLRTCIFGQDTCVIHACACVGVYYMYVYACACVRARACMHACSGQCRSITISLSLSLILSLSLSLSLSVRPSLSLSLSLCSLWADGEAGRTHTHTHTHTLTHTNTHTHTLELGSRGFWGQGLVPKLDKQVFPAACLASKVASNSASGTKARISQQITIIASTESIP